MGKSNATEMEAPKETGNLLQLFKWRLPKKDHDAIVQFDKQVYVLFRKHCIQPAEVFRLKDTESTEEIGFTDFADTVKASKNEELWLELHSYRNHKQLYDISAKMQKDEIARQLYTQFMDLIVPYSCSDGIFGRFNFLS
jgi:uncharacterized protein YbaA (DUF1428 family)